MIEVVSAISNYKALDGPSLGYVVQRLDALGYIVVVAEGALVLRFDDADDPDDERVDHLTQILADDLPEFVVDDVLGDPANQQSMNQLPSTGEEE